MTKIQKTFIRKNLLKQDIKSIVKHVLKTWLKKHYESNIDKVIERKRIYRSTEDYKVNSKIYERGYYEKRKELRKNNINLRISMSIRDILRRCLKYIGKNKEQKTYELLGYNNLKLKQRLECQFKDGMSWDNYGKWHIDHKKPISKFNKGTDLKIINSLSNLQPLWAKDNLSKSNKF